MYDDSNYKRYLTTYAAIHNVTEEEAEQHLIVKYYKEYLEERARNDRKRQEATSAH